MRWIFGKNYDPFKTNMKKGLHPLLAFLKYHQVMFRTFYFGVLYTFPTLLIAIILHRIQSILYNCLYRYKNKTC